MGLGIQRAPYFIFIISLTLAGSQYNVVADFGTHGDPDVIFDESFDGTTFDGFSHIDTTARQSIGQGFTIESESELHAVEAYVGLSNSPTCDEYWEITIWNGPGFVTRVNETPQTHHADYNEGSIGEPHIEHIDFDTPILLVPGEYTLEIKKTVVLFSCVWFFDNNNPYSGGAAWDGADIYKNSAEFCSSPGVCGLADFGFAVYTEPIVNSPPPQDNDLIVGGKAMPIDTTALLLAGTQITASWLIPIVVTSVGIFLVILRKL